MYPKSTTVMRLLLPLKALEVLLLLLLLLHLLPLSHALVTVFVRHRPFALEHFHPKACVKRVAAGEVAVGKAAMGLVLAAVGDELEVTHRVAIPLVLGLAVKLGAYAGAGGTLGDLRLAEISES